MFYFDYNENTRGNYSILLFTVEESFYEFFSKDKEIFDLSIYSAKSKYYDDTKKSVVSKIKDETAGAELV